MVYPISDLLMVNVGLNYQLTYFKGSQDYPKYSDKIFSPDKIRQSLGEKNISNIANLELGISYAF